MYKENYRQMTLELNASDARGYGPTLFLYLLLCMLLFLLHCDQHTLCNTLG